MKPTAEELGRYERFLDDLRAPQERSDAMSKAVEEINEAVAQRNWSTLGELCLEVLASAAYLSFVDDLITPKPHDAQHPDDQH